MDKLKTVLKRMSEDREDGIDRHPFLDPMESKKLDEKLRKVLKLNSAAEGEVAEEAAEASDDEDGEKILTVQERLLNVAEDNYGADDAEILKAIFDIIKEKQVKETAEDGEESDDEE